MVEEAGELAVQPYTKDNHAGNTQRPEHHCPADCGGEAETEEESSLAGLQTTKRSPETET